MDYNENVEIICHSFKISNNCHIEPYKFDELKNHSKTDNEEFNKYSDSIEILDHSLWLRDNFNLL